MFGFVIFITFIISHPAEAMEAASNGLLLWYHQVLPALLPMAILSNLMVYSNYMHMVTKYLYPITKHLVPTSRNGCFAVLGGIFFGFPMGSKISADLVSYKKISCQEGELLTICFNQLSPVFLSGYIMTSILDMPEMIIATYVVLYIPILVFGNICFRFSNSKNNGLHISSQNVSVSTIEKNTASNFKMNFEIIDAGIMNGFESLTKLGGYIILFSVFAMMMRTCNTQYPFINLLCTGLIEVTTGISYLKDLSLPAEYIYSLAIFFASFGGLCGFAQTCSMTAKCSFSKSRYLICKLIFASISTILGFFIYLFLHF